MKGATVSDELVAQLREHVGEPVAVTLRPHVTVATPDAIRAFARAYGDDNPRYGADDEDDGRPSSRTAPPLFPLAAGIPAPDLTPPPLRTALGELARHPFNVTLESWTLMDPVPEGCCLQRRDQLHAITQHEGGVVDVTIRSSFHVGEHVYAHRDRRKTYGAAASSVPGPGSRRAAEYSAAELAAIDDLYRRQTRRGPRPRYIADVAVGDALGPIVKGPLTVTDLVCYRAGVGPGPFAVEPLRLAWLNRQERPSAYTPNQAGIPDAGERCHWDNDHARSLGHPAAWDYTHTRLTWMSHLLDDWMGDEGRIRTIDFQLTGMNYVGDTHWVHGTVTAVDAASGAVEIDLYAVNQLGDRTCHGAATVSLPRGQVP